MKCNEGKPKLTCEKNNINGNFESPMKEAHTIKIFVQIDLDHYHQGSQCAKETHSNRCVNAIYKVATWGLLAIQHVGWCGYGGCVFMYDFFVAFGHLSINTKVDLQK